MARIFVSRRPPGDSLDPLLNSGNEVIVSEFDRPLTSEEFIERAKGADAVLSFLTDVIDADVIDAIGPQVKIFSNYAVGFNNIKVEDATEKGVVITNTPSDEVNESVAEFTWALMLSIARRVVESDEVTKKGAYKGWEPGIFLGSNLSGKTLGIVGMGRIGSMVAKRAQGWNMHILYTKRGRDEEAEREFGVEYRELDQLLRESDFVSLHVPLTPETTHMINREKFELMKNGALIINTARGPIIQESDLVESLRNGRLGGAALDVFENEPTINAELVGMENVILTPHIASATWEARNKMGEQAVNAILSVLSGEKPETIVNSDVWENRRS